MSDDVPFRHQPGPAGIAVTQSQSSGKTAIDLVNKMAAEDIVKDDAVVVQEGVTWTKRRVLYVIHPGLYLRLYAPTLLLLHLDFDQVPEEWAAASKLISSALCYKLLLGASRRALLLLLQYVS